MGRQSMIITATDDEQDINEFVRSLGVTHEVIRGKITRVELLGSGGRGSDVNSRSSFFLLSGGEAGAGVRVATTNGDPIWEEQDVAGFIEHAAACGVDL